MIIFTDNISHSKKYFDNFNEIPNNNDFKISAKLESEFFKTKPFILSSENEFWRFAFINEVFENSQFDLLINLSGKNKLVADKTICLAGYGRKFHGFHNRAWESALGNIHLSCYFNPNAESSHIGLSFTMLAAVSVIETLDSIEELKNKAQIKWINDIIINDSKICGVIAHNQIQGCKISDAILGIGLNVEKAPEINPTSFIRKATSINNECQQKQDIAKITNILLSKIAINYDLLLSDGYKVILDKYLQRSLIIGKNINIWSDNYEKTPQIIRSGKVVSIGEYLELYLENQPEPVMSGRLELI